ncbi:MAG: hypothetical protein WC840_05860 [Candidatus Peribacteraceae bacterium]
MYKPVRAIEVRIWGKTVGAVVLALIGCRPVRYRHGAEGLKQVREAVAAWPDFAGQAGVNTTETNFVSK